MTKDELIQFISMNIPIVVRAKRKSKTVFVDVFTSQHAFETVINVLTERLHEKIMDK